MDSKKIDFIFESSLLKLSRKVNIYSGLWPFLTKKEQIAKNFVFIVVLTLTMIPGVRK